MKKIVTFVGALLFWGSTSAAVVSVENTFGGPYVDQDTYFNLGTEYIVYLKTGLADPALNENGGEELIYLGAHTGTGTGGTIEVNVSSTGNLPTGPVSFVLSASAATVWDFNVDLTKVDVRNIFIIASELDQSLDFDGTSLSLGIDANNSSDSYNGVQITRLQAQTCGFEYPAVIGDCNTDEILGIASELNSPPFVENFLDLLTSSDPTAFAGTHFVESFNVVIDNIVVPLPAGLLLFASSLGLLIAARRSS